MIDISNRKKIIIRDKKITVIGLGMSGTAAAILANYLGARVFGSDISDNFQVNNHALYLLDNFIIKLKLCVINTTKDTIQNTKSGVINIFIYHIEKKRAV